MLWWFFEPFKCLIDSKWGKLYVEIEFQREIHEEILKLIEGKLMSLTIMLKRCEKILQNLV